VHCFCHPIWLVVLIPFQSRATMPSIVPNLKNSQKSWQSGVFFL
jgi:hypothetical protein